GTSRLAILWFARLVCRATVCRHSFGASCLAPLSPSVVGCRRTPLGILTRYVFFDLVKVFLLTLSVMTLMMFLGLMGKEAIDTGLGLGGLLRLTPYILPNARQFTLPGALLLATTGVYGRMAASNE